MIMEIILFVSSIFFSFILHEFFHKWAVEIQGGVATISIWFYQPFKKYEWFKIPSMKCSFQGDIRHLYFVYFAGGLGSGCCFIVLSLIAVHINFIVFAGLFCASMIQIFYGLFEGFFRDFLDDDVYMRYHYFVELSGLLTGLIFVIKIGW